MDVSRPSGPIEAALAGLALELDRPEADLPEIRRRIAELADLFLAAEPGTPRGVAAPEKGAAGWIWVSRVSGRS